VNTKLHNEKYSGNKYNNYRVFVWCLSLFWRQTCILGSQFEKSPKMKLIPDIADWLKNGIHFHWYELWTESDSALKIGNASENSFYLLCLDSLLTRILWRHTWRLLRRAPSPLSTSATLKINYGELRHHTDRLFSFPWACFYAV